MTRSELHDLLSDVLTDFTIASNDAGEVIIITALREDPETGEFIDPEEELYLGPDEDFLPRDLFDVVERYNDGEDDAS